MDLPTDDRQMKNISVTTTLSIIWGLVLNINNEYILQ